MKKTASALLVVFLLAFYACNKEPYKAINTGKEKSAASGFLASISVASPRILKLAPKQPTPLETSHCTQALGFSMMRCWETFPQMLRMEVSLLGSEIQECSR